jgi:hypothetical protein
MKRLVRFLIRLYPANWRERYGEEFDALLEDSSPGWSGIFDLMKGAVKMQLSVPAFPKLALILSLGGLLCGLAVSFLLTPIYISEAALKLTASGQAAHPDLTEYLIRSEQRVLSRASLKNIIQDPRLDLYKSERTIMPLEDVIERMRRTDIRIRVVAPGATNHDHVSFLISFSYPDKRKAQQTVQALLVRFVDLKLTNSSVPAPMNLDVLHPPSLPVNPARPNRYLIAAWGFGIGFLTAVLVAICRRKLPPIPLPAQTA